MSGIVGIVRWDGEKTDPRLIRQMAGRIEHRGPDGIHYHFQDEVSFGYLHLNVTSDSLFEAQLAITASGRVLVADVRLDNRRELIDLLGLESQVGGKTVSDGQLILAAYEKWKEKCPDYLVGDFAFAIWDPAVQTLFCARDHAGIRPFYFQHEPGRYLLFASEIKALWAFDGLKKKIDSNRVANYLCNWGQQGIYQHNTFYQGVNSLPPAHCLAATCEQLTERIHWNIDPDRYQFSSDAEYLAAFANTFREAVRCRIQSPFRVSSFLSGGLDSSSVAAVASTLLSEEQRTLDTFYIDTQLPETSERDYVLPFLDRHAVRHHEVVADPDYYGHLEEVAKITDMPEMFSLTYNHFTPILRAVSEANSRVLLTGSDGDTVVGYGTEYIYEAIGSGYWAEAARRLSQAHDPRDYQQVYGPTEGKKIYAQRMVALLLGKLPALYGSLAAKWQFLKGTLFYLKISPWQLAQIFLKKFIGKAPQNVDYKVHPELPGQCLPTMKEGSHLHPTTNLLLNRGVFYQLMSEVSEYYDIIGAHYQVQICHPFFDKRLIELCLFIPEKLKFFDGYGRGPLREAMKAYLPEKILRRKSKIDFTPYMNKQLADQVPAPETIIEANQPLLEGYLVKNVSAKSPENSPKSAYSRLHHRILYFLHWRKAQGI